MPQDRPSRRAEEGLYRSGNRVGLFIDYENIRRSIENSFSTPPAARVLAEKLYELSSGFGRVLVANAYADWSASEMEPRELRRRQIEPCLVLARESGDDRAGVTLSLDAVETLFEDPGLDVYVIASGNSDLHDLFRRLRRRGKGVVVCGGPGDTGRELIRGADKFVPLDELLGAKVRPAPSPMDWEGYEWSSFIRLIRDLDRKLNFVGLRYVATKVLNPQNCGLSDRGQKQDLLNQAIDLSIIEPYQVENIDAGGEPVSACRLNMGHPLVKEVLAGDDEAVSAPESPEAPEAPAAPPETPAEAPPSRSYHSSLGSDDLGRPGEISHGGDR